MATQRLAALLTALAAPLAAAHTLRGHGHRRHRHGAPSLSLLETHSAAAREARRMVAAFETRAGVMEATILSVGARLWEAKELFREVVQDAPKAKQPAPAKRKEAPKGSGAVKENASAVVKLAEGTEAKKSESKLTKKADKAKLPAVHLVDQKKQDAVDAALKKHNFKDAMAGEKDILEGLFSHLKGNIAKFNEKEKRDKVEHAAMLKGMQERLAADQARLKSPNLSAFQHEELVNRTRLEEREVKFWSQGRDLQHQMFHSNLKLTHGLMERVKTVMEAYKQQLSKGHVDPKMLRALKAVSLPKAFVQMCSHVTTGLRGHARRHRHRRARGTALLEIQRGSAALESEVSAMEATVLSVGARLWQARELLRMAMEEVPKAKATTASKAKSAGQKNATAAAKTASKADVEAKPAQKVEGSKMPAVHLVDQKKQDAVDAAVKKRNFKAAMAGEKDILEGLFSHLKANIAKFNFKEKKDKVENSAMLKNLQERLAADKEKLKSTGLSAFQHEELVNRTRLEEREVKYWSRARDLQHESFHSNLKLTHGLLERVKTVMEAYKQQLSKGHVDPKMLKELAAVSLPKAFVQMGVRLQRLTRAHRRRLIREVRTLAAAAR